MKRVLELDGLRFFAILAVIAVHYRPPYRPALFILSLGWVGVDLFFVISGFLITSILASLRSSSHPYRVFYWRRTLRIFPPYYLVVIPLVAHQFLGHLSLAPVLTWEPLLFLSAFAERHPVRLVITALLHGGPLNHMHSPVDNHLFDQVTNGFGVLWSLSFEELFYLAWAPIMLRCSRSITLAILAIVIAVSPVLRMLGHTPDFRECFFIPFHFDTLAMGSLLGLVFIAYRKGEIGRASLKKGLLVAGALSATSLVALALREGVLQQVELRSTLGFAGVGYSLVGAFFVSVVGICVLCAGSETAWISWLRARPLVYLGTISYMLYLIHIPIWVLTWKVASRLAGHTLGPSLWLGFLAALVAVGAASISWKFFEKPILRYKDAAFAVPRQGIATVVAEP